VFAAHYQVCVEFEAKAFIGEQSFEGAWHRNPGELDPSWDLPKRRRPLIRTHSPQNGWVVAVIDCQPIGNP
jgi:hypothetical protein